MSTLYFPSAEVTIYRRRRIGSTNRFGMSATFTAYQADIQPSSQQRTEFVSGRFGSIYTGFFDVSVPLKENDQIVITDTGKRFSVKGTQVWQGAGLLDHLEAVLVAQDSD